MAEAKTQVPPLRYCSELLEQIDRVFNWLENAVSTVLPDASIEHIGSSAVPGSLTKGDVDIMVLVDETDFSAAKHALDEAFGYNPEIPPEADFVSYSGEYQGTDFGIQLVCGNDDKFGFIRWREALKADSELLEQYNQAKVSRAHCSMDEYREAKSGLILRYLEEH